MTLAPPNFQMSNKSPTSWSSYESRTSLVKEAAFKRGALSMWTGFMEFAPRDNILEVAVGLHNVCIHMVGCILVILKLTLTSRPPLLVWSIPSLSSLHCPSYHLYLEASRRKFLSCGKDMMPLRGTTHELKRLRMVLLSLAMGTCQVFFFLHPCNPSPEI